MHKTEVPTPREHGRTDSGQPVFNLHCGDQTVKVEGPVLRALLREGAGGQVVAVEPLFNALNRELPKANLPI